jgi:PAS domain S-box-containing protein
MAANEGQADEAAPAADTEKLAHALQAQQSQFSRDFGDAPVGIIAIGLSVSGSCKYLAVNDAYCQQTGYSGSELIGKDFLGIFHPEDQPPLDDLVHVIATEAEQSLAADARIVTREGDVMPVRLTGQAIRPDCGARYLAVFCQDISANLQLRAELGQLEAELAQSRRRQSLGQLAEGIAHDFNNLLTVISSYSSLVHDEITVAESSQGTSRWGPVRWDVRQIEEATDRAKRLVKHLMAFTRREQAEPAIADPGRLTADAAALLQGVLGERITISVHPDSGLWQVNVDPAMLRQAIINIALNAREAMPAGGQIDVTFDNVDTGDANLGAAGYSPADLGEFAQLLPGRYVLIRISDTGVGMDSVIAERAFEPFFTTKTTDEGAGLGLSAVHRFAARTGGRAWLNSHPGEGTTVTLMLPGAPASSAVKGDLDGASTETYAGTVLVADDELAIRDVAHRVLTSAGYRVMTAGNGPEAIALLASQAPIDLLLADVVMPGITAGEFLARAREACPGIRMLFMSGYERPEDAHGWPDASVEVITKPFTRPTLLVKVQQAMAATTERAHAAR